MALAHHDAAHRDQRSRGEAEFFRAQQSRNHYVATSLEFAVGLHSNVMLEVDEAIRISLDL